MNQSGRRIGEGKEQGFGMGEMREGRGGRYGKKTKIDEEDGEAQITTSWRGDGKQNDQEKP